MSLARHVRRSPALATLRLVRLNLVARTSGHEDWGPIIDRDRALWDERRANAAGPRVLITTGIGGHFALSAIDRLLAVALTLRGARVSLAYCDAALSACQIAEIGRVASRSRLATRAPSADFCSYCHGPARAASEALGLPVLRYGSYLNAADRADAALLAATTPMSRIGDVKWRDFAIGEHARAGALRFFAKSDIAGEPNGEAVLRRYLESAALTAVATERMLAETGADVVVAHHGIYVPQGVVGSATRRAGKRLVTWNPAYRRSSFIFSHDDTYHHTLMDEPVEAWSDPLTPDEEAEIVAYLTSRRRGTRDWIVFHDNRKSPDDVVAALDLDPALPVIAAFTTVFWDAQLHYRANIYPSQRDWLVDTIAWAAYRPDLQLVVRVHPAEATGAVPSRQSAVEEIKAAFPDLPANVRVIPPTSPISSYALAERANAAVIFATKMGVELTAIGLPVIVAGEAWIRNKGLTIDPNSPADYRAVLDRLPMPTRLPDDKVRRALAYADHFFFRRMIELKSVAPHPGPRQFRTAVTSLGELEAGGDPGLDTICDGILKGTPFVLPRP